MASLEVVIKTQELNLLVMANSVTVHATQLHLLHRLENPIDFAPSSIPNPTDPITISQITTLT